MSQIEVLVEKYNREYGDSFLKFATERDLPLDVDIWKESDQLEWYKIANELSANLGKAVEAIANLPLDEREADDWYKIDITLDTTNGPEYEVIDVREVPLERLQNICKMFPKYNEYYFEKVANSL